MYRNEGNGRESACACACACLRESDATSVANGREVLRVWREGRGEEGSGHGTKDAREEGMRGQEREFRRLNVEYDGEQE